MRKILTIILQLIVFFGFAQMFPVKHYSLKEGLANSQVTAIYQDSKGFIWFSTLGSGISKFDGKAFTNYNQENGLKSEVVRAITEDKINNRFVIGTMGQGIHFLKDDTITKFEHDAIPAEIFSVFTDKKGTIWIGAMDGLYFLEKNNKVIDFNKSLNIPKGSITHISSDFDGNLWFNYDEHYGLCKYDGKFVIRFDSTNGLTNGRVLSSFHDSDKNTWVAAFDGLYLIKHNATNAIKIEGQDLPNYYIFDFAEPKKNTLLIATQDRGLLVFDTKTKQVTGKINNKTGLKSALVFRVFTDYENNVWISNWGDGVAKVNFSGLLKYEENQELKARLVNDIFEFDNKTYLATNNGVFCKENNIITPYKENLVQNSVVQFFKNKTIELYAKDKELILIKDGKLKKFTSSEFAGIRSIVSDKNGIVYITGWGCGLLKYVDGNFETVKDTVFNHLQYFYTSFVDSKNNLWLGSWDGGALKYDGKNWSQIGLNGELPSTKVTSFAEDLEGNIIIGTLGGGIAYFKDDKPVVFNSKIGLPSNTVYSLAVDSENKLYVGMQGVISVIDLKTNEMLSLNAVTGFDGDCMYNSVLYTQNQIWFGTNNYLWTINNQFNYPLNKNLRIYLENCKVNYQTIDSNHDNIFGYKQNKFSFTFFTTQVYDNQNVKYSYRLLGSDSVFSPLTSNNEVTFHELKHGNYKFEVKACLNNECSDVLATYSFTISPPFWLKWWFWLLVFVFTLITIKFYINYRERKLIEKQKELEDIVEIRTKEIVEQKKIVENKNIEITDSIHYAQKIQSALLPNEEVFKSVLPDSFILFKPKDIVSGDFYWLSDREDFIYYATADCTGHGVPGGFMSMLGTALLNEIVDERKVLDCGEVLNLMREKIMLALKQAGDSESKDGMDMVLIRIDKNSLEMQYAAANNSFYIVQRRETGDMRQSINLSKEIQDLRQEVSHLTTHISHLEELPCDKMPVGVYYSELKPFRTFNYQLEKGDIIYTYTDGYADQFGGLKEKKYTYKRLREKLLEISELPLEEQKEILAKEFEKWQGNLEQIDDVCLIGVKV